MKIGSEAHKELFCQSFMESYQEYDPETLPWPDLDDATLDRLRGIPFWEEALTIEREAGVMVTAFAETVSDPMIREAIALQGREEARHAQLIEHLIQRYDVKITDPPPPVLPANIETAFIDFGFGECLDTFFAFGLFELARQANYFPDALFKIFDPIIHEEARHIVFFVNWVTYLQINQGKESKVLQGTHAVWHYSRAIMNLVKAFGSGAGDGSGTGFTATGAQTFIDDLTPTQFLETALKENTRRMSIFDDRLLQPQLMPRLAAIAYRTLKLLNRGQGSGVRGQGSVAQESAALRH